MAMIKKMITVTNTGDRLKALENLAKVVARSIDECEDPKNLAQLARQYRETLKEIAELKGVGENDDEIGEILKARETTGKPGAVRKNRAKV